MLQAEQTCQHKRRYGRFCLQAFILAAVLVSEFMCYPRASDALHFCALVLAKPGISHGLAHIFPGYLSAVPGAVLQFTVICLCRDPADVDSYL